MQVALKQGQGNASNEGDGKKTHPPTSYNVQLQQHPQMTLMTDASSAWHKTTIRSKKLARAMKNGVYGREL